MNKEDSQQEFINLQRTETIERFICKEYMVTMDGMMEHHRSNDESEARMVLMFLLFRETKLASKEIAERYDRVEGSFTHAWRTISDRYKLDTSLRAIVRSCENALGK